MHNTGEILQLCRLCLVKEQVNVPIFEGQGDVKQIFQKISSCLPVKINRSDKLPKNICDGCSEKLDLFYDFWNTSVNSEKQLLEWLGQTPLSAGAGTTIAAKNSKSTDPVQQIKVDVKQEPSDHTDNNESFQADASAVADEDETSFKSESGPPPKRARRAATKRKPITVAPDTDDDDDDDYEPVEPLTKLEDESGNSDNDNEDDSFANAPSTSADDQPGPSGIGKDGVEAPKPPRGYRKSSPQKDLDAVIEFHYEPLLEHIKEEPDKNPKKKKPRTPRKNTPKKLKVPKPPMEPLPDLEDPITCDLCNETFRNNVAFAAHSIKHSDEQKYECHLCDFKSIKCFKIKTHVRTHEGTTRYKCDICAKSFEYGFQAIEHKNFHTGEKPFQCDICGKNFMFSWLLNSHRRSSHYEIVTGKPLDKYDCKICNKHYVSSGGLKRHQRSNHEDDGIDRSVLCVTCGKRLSSKEKLKFHERIHTGAKPFACLMCPKTFAKKDYLKDHERVHTGERPHICKYCGKGFTQKSSLTIHERIHTGERPYVCKVCGRGFVTKGIMDNHSRTCSM